MNLEQHGSNDTRDLVNKTIIHYIYIKKKLKVKDLTITNIATFRKYLKYLGVVLRQQQNSLVHSALDDQYPHNFFEL